MSRRYNPQGTSFHIFPRGVFGNAILPRCACGGKTVQDGNRVRDIVDLKIKVHETRHVIEKARCPGCGTNAEAPSGLPKKKAHTARHWWES